MGEYEYISMCGFLWRFKKINSSIYWSNCYTWVGWMKQDWVIPVWVYEEFLILGQLVTGG